MARETPGFLLFTDAEANDQNNRWHFSLESVDGNPIVVVTEEDAEHPISRLELLAAVRGLEALDQPSNVTLVTNSAYVRRGIRFGIDEWRKTEWRWERFGRMAPVTNGDLWQRLDRAMQIHSVKLRSLRVDRASSHVLRGPHFAKRANSARNRRQPATLARRAQKQAS